MKSILKEVLFGAKIVFSLWASGLTHSFSNQSINSLYWLLFPVSAMFNQELENMGRHYGTDNLDDFFMVALKEYKDKCRKKENK